MNEKRPPDVTPKADVSPKASKGTRVVLKMKQALRVGDRTLDVGEPICEMSLAPDVSDAFVCDCFRNGFVTSEPI